MNHDVNDWQVTLNYDLHGQLTEAQVDQILDLTEAVDGAGAFSLDSEEVSSAGITVTSNAPTPGEALLTAIGLMGDAWRQVGVTVKSIEYIEVCRYDEED